VTVLEVLTGTGLATSAGLNAYVPLLAIGLLDRYTTLIELPSGWEWLAGGWALVVLAVLLAVEVVADKVPVVDHVNDIVQTVVRPAAGGIAFGASSDAHTVTVSDPGHFFGGHQWVPVALGVVMALFVHGAKATVRPVVNVSTAGVGGPVVSTIEDAVSVVLAVVAIVLPILVLVLLVLLVWAFAALLRRRRRRRTASRQAASRQAPRDGGTLRLPGA
jgi:hypothetical protein